MALTTRGLEQALLTADTVQEVIIEIMLMCLTTPMRRSRTVQSQSRGVMVPVVDGESSMVGSYLTAMAVEVADVSA
jgi:hypothetical protein